MGRKKVLGEVERLNVSHLHVFNYFPGLVDIFFPSSSPFAPPTMALDLLRKHRTSEKSLVCDLPNETKGHLDTVLPDLSVYLECLHREDSLQLLNDLLTYTHIRAGFELRHRAGGFSRDDDIRLAHEVSHFMELTPYKTLAKAADPFFSKGLATFFFWNGGIHTPRHIDELVFSQFVKSAYDPQYLYSGQLLIQNPAVDDVYLMEYVPDESEGDFNPGYIIESRLPKEAALEGLRRVDSENLFHITTTENLIRDYFRVRFEEEYPVHDCALWPYVPSTHFTGQE